MTAEPVEPPAPMTALRRAVSALTPAGFLCLGLIAWGLFVWKAGILHEGFDHDEFEHTHVAWLIAHGRRPFYDFFECHPPFLWYPLALILRLTGDRLTILFVFRFLTAAGHLAFLAAIARNVSLTLDSLQVKRTSPTDFAGVFALGLVVIAAHPAVLPYLIEFRLDAWPNALLLFAIYRYRSSLRDPLRSCAELGFLAVVAIACSPKLLLFAAAFIGLDLLSAALSRPSADRPVRRLAGLAIGGAAAVAFLLLVLLALRLDPRVVFRLVITYHARLNERAGFAHGLAKNVWAERVLLAVVVASAAACIAHLRGRLRSHPFEAAIIVFLGAQLVLVGVPNKQYYGPWFLMGVALFPHLLFLVARVNVLRSLLVAAAIVYGASNVLDDHQLFAHGGRAPMEILQRRQVLDLVPPGGTVVASMERHPMFRPDALYHIVSSSAPSGYGTNQIMAAMNLPPFSARFSTESYIREMEDRPPEMIVIKGWFRPEQQLAIDAFISRHRGEYRWVESALGPIWIRQRL